MRLATCPSRVAGLALITFCMPGLCHAQPAAAQPTPGESEDSQAAKKLSNPMSDLVSVPFQFNWEQNVGPFEQTRFILNVQPVMPFTMNKDWNLVARVIVPLVSQPALTEGSAPPFGVSDVLTSFRSGRRGRSGEPSSLSFRGGTRPYADAPAVDAEVLRIGEVVRSVHRRGLD